MTEVKNMVPEERFISRAECSTEVNVFVPLRFDSFENFNSKFTFYDMNINNLPSLVNL